MNITITAHTAQEVLPVIYLSVSCVSYQSNEVLLNETLQSLATSCAQAKKSQQLARVSLALIDNGPDAHYLAMLERLKSRYSQQFDELTIVTGHGNIGYGRANNLSLLGSQSHYHLVLNPDVILKDDNIELAIDYMQKHSDVGLLAPDAFDAQGERQYIAKRAPSFFVLLTRMLRFAWLQKTFARQLAHYEYRDQIPAQQPIQIALASGCFMLLRTVAAQQINGFNEGYFMYFEDFDLSRRMSKHHQIIHHPKIKIVHQGGGVTTKGFKHLVYFFNSYRKYIKTNKNLKEE